MQRSTLVRKESTKRRRVEDSAAAAEPKPVFNLQDCFGELGLCQANIDWIKRELSKVSTSEAAGQKLKSQTIIRDFQIMIETLEKNILKLHDTLREYYSSILEIPLHLEQNKRLELAEVQLGALNEENRTLNERNKALSLQLNALGAEKDDLKIQLRISRQAHHKSNYENAQLKAIVDVSRDPLVWQRPTQRLAPQFFTPENLAIAVAELDALQAQSNHASSTRYSNNI